MFTNIILNKQLRVKGWKKMWLGNLENTLIQQTAQKSGVILENHSLRVTENKPLAQGDRTRTEGFPLPPSIRALVLLNDECQGGGGSSTYHF